MKLTVTRLFGQKDVPWGPQKLGTSAALISSEGCLLTVAAMVCCYHGKDTDPGRLNDALIPVKGFYQRSKLIYGAIADLYPDITVDWYRYVDCPDTPAPLETIYQALDAKLIPLLKIDTQPAPGIQEHWVAAIGYNDADKELIVWDPWDKAEYFFVAKYGDPKTKIWRIVVYQGPLPQEPPPNNGLEQEKRLNDLAEKVVSAHNQVNTLSNQVSDVLRKVGDMQKDITTIYEDRDTLSEIKAKITENTNRINEVQVANTKATTDLKGEVRDLKQWVEGKFKGLEEKPVEGEGEKFDVLCELGSWFIGRRR